MIKVEETKTTPKKESKKPRTIWEVSGTTEGYEQILFDLGCSKRRWRGKFTFWNEDPTIDIANAIKENKRLSFAERQEQKIQKSHYRLERCQELSNKARYTSKKLTEENIEAANRTGGAPIKYDHHSANMHRKELEKMRNRSRKSAEELDKATHYDYKATNIKYKLNKQETSPTYLNNRIEERKAHLRSLERNKNNITNYESRKSQLEEELNYFQTALDNLMAKKEAQGFTIPTPDTVNKGDMINYRDTWYPVKKVNKKTVTISNWHNHPDSTWSVAYPDIIDIKKTH